jgi:hypothetical protein
MHRLHLMWIFCLALLLTACGGDPDEAGNGNGQQSREITYDLYRTIGGDGLMGTIKVEERDAESVYVTVTPTDPDFERTSYQIRLLEVAHPDSSISTDVPREVRSIASIGDYDRFTGPDWHLDVITMGGNPTARADKGD